MKSETLTKFLFINFEEAYMPNWARGPLNLKETKKKLKETKQKTSNQVNQSVEAPNTMIL